ncbi:hypothetical protein AK812_SmicGene2749 [Symbiodinium microadriaticum]|uniref:Uncharacterized protein n=1 Tax=Symbiodinium microadriaticum TaxID=2951 RepID=A0A1Q9F0T3_SYMMI|nr:hypothetical protein AK812_SmicGene2749 [Symbiodinium microadriaticum]
MIEVSRLDNSFANANKLAEKLDLSMEDFRMQDSDLEAIVEPLSNSKAKDAEEAIAAEEADSIDPETPTVVEVPSQPWAEDLGRSVGGFTRSAPGGGTTGADKDDEAAAEAVKPKLPEDSTNELDRLGLEDLPPEAFDDFVGLGM